MAMEINFQKHLKPKSEDIEITRIRNQIIRILDNIMLESQKKAIMGVKSENMIILLPIDNEIKDKKNKLCQIGEKIVNRIMQDIQDITVLMGIGRVYENLEDLSKSYQDAKKAIAIGPNITDKKVVHFDDLGIYRLLYQQIEHEELIRFYKQFIDPLETYDNKRGTELVKTLETYFECNGNFKKISKKLFVHYNTVLYRLNKIQKIVDINLDNPHDRLNMEMALRTKRVIK
jgi:purine catabolism regulator